MTILKNVQRFNRFTLRGIVVIPNDFATKLDRNEIATAQVITDGSEVTLPLRPKLQHCNYEFNGWQYQVFIIREFRLIYSIFNQGFGTMNR